MDRRLVERGVRFVEIIREAWDQHGDLVIDISKKRKDTDQASAALIIDLKQRDMLDDTLVVWGGEFGRTPLVAAGSGGAADGREVHPNAFTLWLAGSSVKPGLTLGKTDEPGSTSPRFGCSSAICMPRSCTYWASPTSISRSSPRGWTKSSPAWNRPTS